jgi:hypothetical protein
MCWAVNSQAAVEHRLVNAIEGSEAAVQKAWGVTFRKRFAHFLMELEGLARAAHLRALCSEHKLLFDLPNAGCPKARAHDDASQGGPA